MDDKVKVWFDPETDVLEVHSAMPRLPARERERCRPGTRGPAGKDFGFQHSWGQSVSKGTVGGRVGSLPMSGSTIQICCVDRAEFIVTQSLLANKIIASRGFYGTLDSKMTTAAPVERSMRRARPSPALMKGTTNVRVLYLGYEFYRRTGKLKEWACGLTLSCYAAIRTALQ